MQVKTSKTIKKVSTEVLQRRLDCWSLPRIIPTSPLFALPRRWISSCFAKRYLESAIIFSNNR